MQSFWKRAGLQADPDLLPCPFCGSPATFLISIISCAACRADMHKGLGTVQGMIDAWNKRTPK